MPESQQNVHDVIASYRRRRERLLPLAFGALAVLLLGAGVVLIVVWMTGGGAISLPFLATETPEPSATPTVTLTPTETLTPTITETPTPEGPRTYIVQEGDNLWSIAAEFEVDILLLMSVNGITDANQIFIGQELTIPPPGTERPTSTPLPETLVPGTRITHVVERGETLESIAALYSSTAEAIALASGIRVTDTIGEGQRLTVPVNIATPTPTTIALAPSATPTP